MSWWSRGAASWRDLARDQLLEMLRPVRGDAPAPGSVTNSVTPPPIVVGGYLIKQDGGYFLKQDGGYFLRQTPLPFNNVILDVDGFPLIDTSGQYVTES